MSMNTKANNRSAWEVFIISISPPSKKNRTIEIKLLNNHWVQRYVFAGIYWESFLFVILLTANPWTPINARVPPVIKLPSFGNPVAPDKKSTIRPIRPINTEIIFKRVIISSL